MNKICVRVFAKRRSKSYSDVNRTPPKPPAKPPRQFSQGPKEDAEVSSTPQRVASHSASAPTARERAEGEPLQKTRSHSRSAEVLTSSPTKSPRSPVKVISAAAKGGGMEIATTIPAKSSTTVKTVVTTETKETRTGSPVFSKRKDAEHAKIQETHFGKIPGVGGDGKKTTVTEIIQESKTTVQESKVPAVSSTPDVSQIPRDNGSRPQVSITRSVSDRRYDADKPTIVVKQGRFDVVGLLRETDRIRTRPRSESPSRVDLHIRLAELDKTRVKSTKIMFENSQPSTSGSAPALQRRSASTDSPYVSDSDSERHTDTELVARNSSSRQLSPSISDSRLPGDSKISGSSSPRFDRVRDISGSDRPRSMGASAERRSTPTSEVESLPRSSPYPSPPPGFLLPKHINGTTSKPSVATSPTVTAARGPFVSDPPKGKAYNVPILPSELGNFAEGPLTHLPGQLPRTKSQLRQGSPVPLPLSDKTPPDSPKHSSERGKRVSPRSARAQFFSEASSPNSSKSLKTQVAQERKAANNNNSAASPKRQPAATKDATATRSTTGTSKSASGATGGATGTSIPATSGKASAGTVGASSKSSHPPPSKASPWSASPGASIPQQQRMSSQPATKGSKKGKSLIKSSKKWFKSMYAILLVMWHNRVSKRRCNGLLLIAYVSKHEILASGKWVGADYLYR